MNRTEIYAAIDAERTKQDRQWGGPDHDRQHNIWHWLEFIRYQYQLAKNGLLDEYKPLTKAHYRLIKIAALAVAALETLPDAKSIDPDVTHEPPDPAEAQADAKCAACGGSGTEDGYHIGDSHYTGIGARVCDICHGTGERHLPIQRMCLPCLTCDGTGYAKESAE